MVLAVNEVKKLKIKDKSRPHQVSTYATENEMAELRKKTGHEYNYTALRSLIDGVIEGTIKVPKSEA